LIGRKRMAAIDSLANCRVAILGLGLMGGSLALRLRGQCARLLGCDPDPATLRLARQMGLVEQVSDSAAEVVPQADLLVLAAPVGAILRILDELPALQPEPAAVLDLGSTKAEIVQRMQALPERFDPLGGHPMCGKEVGGLANADAWLFEGATFALTPLPRTSPSVRQIAEQLISVIGAKPLWLEAETHDRWVAATSHVPYLAANALAAITPPEARPLVGPGLRSSTRLAPTSWSMMRPVLETNRENILSGLQHLRQQIEALEDALAAEDLQALGRLTAQGASNYERLMK
jgi:prephenate dehydrogenase